MEIYEGSAGVRGFDTTRLRIKRETGSHKILARDDWSDLVFAFRDSEEIGPRMLARIAKHAGLKPEDL